MNKVIVAKSRVKFDVYCADNNLNPREQIHVYPNDVYRAAGLKLFEDQVVIIDKPCDELQQMLSAMTIGPSIYPPMIPLSILLEAETDPAILEKLNEIIELLKR